MSKIFSKLLNSCAFGLALAATSPAIAQTEAAPPPAIDVSLDYKVDVIGPVSGGLRNRFYGLDNLDLKLDADLGRVIGWKGATAHIHLLNNFGAIPNDGAGTLQGIDNIEVGSQRARLFEAWLEQAVGDHASIRAGLYDLNSEFYAAPSAGLLLAPPFGIGSEIAATGANGPSIFPSTALAVRFAYQGSQVYVRAAVLNAMARTMGDPGGVNLGFDDGALLVGEVGHEGAFTVAAGGWRYTHRYDDIRALDGNGLPVRRRAAGGYAILDVPLTATDKPRALSAFVRIGVSDGNTTPYKGGWQAGLLVQQVISGRPDSALSLGMHSGLLTNAYRRNAIDAGETPARSESALELTYSDQLLPHFTIQPDVQLIFNPGGDRVRKNALVLGVRSTLSW